MRRRLGLVLGVVVLAASCTPSGPVLFEVLASGGSGGGGGAGGSGSDPDAAVGGPEPEPEPEPDPDLDSDVVFAWRETAPGGVCPEGGYIGTFRCDGPNRPLLSGVTTFELAEGRTETSLTVIMGRLDVVDATLQASDGPVVLQAELTGALDCAEGSFDAEATPQQTLFALLPAGFLAPISVTITGALSPSAQELSGTITIAGGLASCTGPWSARRAP